MNKSLMNQHKYRELLAECVNKELDKIEPTDILQRFEQSKEVEKRVNLMGGDITTNPEIQLLDDEAFALIEQTLRNMKRFIKRELPLWIITQKDTEANK